MSRRDILSTLSKSKKTKDEVIQTIKNSATVNTVSYAPRTPKYNFLMGGGYTPEKEANRHALTNNIYREAGNVQADLPAAKELYRQGDYDGAYNIFSRGVSEGRYSPQTASDAYTNMQKTTAQDPRYLKEMRLHGDEFYLDNDDANSVAEAMSRRDYQTASEIFDRGVSGGKYSYEIANSTWNKLYNVQAQKNIEEDSTKAAELLANGDTEGAIAIFENGITLGHYGYDLANEYYGKIVEAQAEKDRLAARPYTVHEKNTHYAEEKDGDLITKMQAYIEVGDVDGLYAYINSEIEAGNITAYKAQINLDYATKGLIIADGNAKKFVQGNEERNAAIVEQQGIVDKAYADYKYAEEQYLAWNNAFNDRSSTIDPRIRYKNREYWRAEMERLSGVYETEKDKLVQMQGDAAVASAEDYVNYFLNINPTIINARIAVLEPQAEGNETELYYLRGLKTFSELSMEERDLIYEFAMVRQNNGDVLNGAAFSLLDDVFFSGYGDVKKIIEKYGYSEDVFNRMIETLISYEDAVVNAHLYKSSIEFANAHPIIATLLAIPIGLAGGMSSTATEVERQIGNMFSEDEFDKPYNKYAIGHTLSNATDATVGQIYSNIGREYGEGAAFLYGTTHSMGQNIAAAAIPFVGPAVLASNAYSGSYRSAKDRGLSDSAANETAIASAAFEFIFESISIGKIKALGEIPATDLKTVLVNTFKSVAVNTSEEFFTEVANIVFDELRNGDLSEFSVMYQQYLDSGMSPEAAKSKLRGELGSRLGQAAASGAIMGGVMTSVGSTTDYVKNGPAYNEYGSFYFNDDGTLNTVLADLLIYEASNSKNKNVKNYAETLLKRGDNVTQNELGALHMMYYSSLSQEQSKNEPAQDVTPNTSNTEAQATPTATPMVEAPTATASGVAPIVTTAPTATQTTSVRDSMSDKAKTAYDNAIETATDKETAAKEFEASYLRGFNNQPYVEDGTALATVMQKIAYEHGAVDRGRLISKERGVAVQTAETETTATEYTPDAKAALDIALKSATDRDAAAREFEIAYIKGMNGDEFVPDTSEYAALTETMQREAYERGAESVAVKIGEQFSGKDAIAFDNAISNATNKIEAAKEFEDAYTKGFAGEEVTASEFLSEADLRAAHEAGKAAKAALGTVTVAKGVKMSDATVQMFNSLAKATKTHIIVDANSNNQTNGHLTKFGELHVSADAVVKIKNSDGSTRIVKGEDAAMLSVLGHEVTHRLKQLDPKSYAKLRDFVLSRKPGAVERYMSEYGYSKEEAEEEVVSDYVMTELFTNEKTIKELTKKHSGIAKLIRDILAWFRDKLGIESKDLDEAIRLWNNAYNASVSKAESDTNINAIAQNKNTTEGGVKWSRGAESIITTKDVADLRQIGEKSINDFTSAEITKAEKWAKKFYKELGAKSPFFRAWFGDWRAYDNNTTEVVSKKGIIRGAAKNRDTGWNILISRQVSKETNHHSSKKVENAVKYLPYIEDITQNAVLLDSVVSSKENELSVMFHSLYAYTEVFGYPAVLKLQVEELTNEKSGEAILRDYILQSIEEEPISKSKRLSKAHLEETDSSSISISDLFALVKEYDTEFTPKPVNEHLLNEDGTPKVLYHQTENVFTVFDTRREGAGTGDNETPFAIFLKPTDDDIGLNGKIQMPLYAQMRNPLIVKNREALVQKMCEMSKEYAALYKRAKAIDKEYSQKSKDAEDAFNRYVKEFREKEKAEGRTPISRKELYEDEGFKEVWNAESRINDEWQAATAENDKKAKEALTAALEKSEYDSIILKHDEGSFGRSTEAYIVLKPTQVKSATDNIGTFDGDNPDIRYSRAGSEKILYESEAEIDNRYLEAVESGDTDTAQKMVDAAAKAAGYNTPRIYHGTSTGGFTAFDAYGGNFGLFGQGLYFTEDRSVAESYTKKGKGDSPQVYEAYGHTGKTLDMDADADISEWKDAVPDAAEYFEGCKTNEDCFKALKEYCADEEMIKWEAEELITDAIQYNMGYNSITHIGGGRYNKNDTNRHRVYIFFDAAQIKSAETITYDDDGKVIPISQRFNTDNPDIRYSRAGSEEILYESEAEKAQYVADSLDTSNADKFNAQGGTTKIDDITNSLIKAHRIAANNRKEFANAIDRASFAMRKIALDSKNVDNAKTLAANMLLKAAKIISPGADAKAEVEIANALGEAIWAEFTTDRRIETVRSFRDDTIKAVRAEQREAKLSSLREKHGTIKPGEKPAREISLPKKNAEGKKVSQTIRTIMEAEATPDEMIPTLEQLVAEGEFSYDTYTDKEAIADAEAKIVGKGFDAAVRKWFDDVGRGLVSKKNIALGWAIYNNAANAGDAELAVDVLNALVKHQRNAAQALQATRILKKMSPSGQLYAAQRSVMDLQEELEAKYGNKAPTLKIDTELADKVINGETAEVRDQALADLYRDIGKQLPSTFMDKWTAWRYLSMLGNVRTHVRNIGGNAVFAPVVTAKDIVATGIEELVSFVSGGRIQRTKAFVGLGKADRALIAAVWNDYNLIQSEEFGDGKYNDNQNDNKYIEEGRRIFKNKLLEWLRRKNSDALKAEDSWFSHPHYAAALAGYLKANKISAEDFLAMVNDKTSTKRLAEVDSNRPILKAGTTVRALDRDNFGKIIKYNGNNTYKVSFVGERGSAIVDLPANILIASGQGAPKVSVKTLLEIGDVDGVLLQARAYAIKEAKKATFQDSNAFSDLVAKAGRIRVTEGNKYVAIPANMLVEGALPFRRTPANILVRGVEYSPIGVVKALYEGIFEIRSGKKTAADVIDSLSAGLTGTGLMALGAFLVSQGILRGVGGDDEDKEEYLEMMGHQQYALEIGGYSVTLDWLAPESIPFFVGANLAQEWMKDGKMTLEDMLSALSKITDPMLSMSCLQGINDMIESVSYTKSSGLVAVVSGLAVSYAMQGVPTLSGQIDRTTQGNRMTTFVNKGDKNLTTDMQYTIGKLSAKIPGLDYQQVPYIDAWGRTESNGSVGERIFNNMVNPAYVSTYTETKVDTELLRLNDAQDYYNVFPKRADKSFKIDGQDVYLTPGQYTKYATSKGKTSYRIVNKLISLDLYSNLDDDVKAEIISKVYDFANQNAKRICGATVIGDDGKPIGYEPQKWVNDVATVAGAYGLSEAEVIAAYIISGNIEEGIQKRVSTMNDDGEYEYKEKSISGSRGLLRMKAIYEMFPGLTQKQYTGLFKLCGVSDDQLELTLAEVEEELTYNYEEAEDSWIYDF